MIPSILQHINEDRLDLLCTNSYRSFYTDSSLLEKLVGLGERGELKIEVQEVIKDAFDPETQGWKHAVELIESTRIRGKVVLTVP
jgi:hypothetical protein